MLIDEKSLLDKVLDPWAVSNFLGELEASLANLIEGACLICLNCRAIDLCM